VLWGGLPYWEAPTLDIEEKLSELIDDPEFQGIDQRFGRFNLFEALGAVRRELEHSNFLAFLLSPTRPHGLGAEPLRRILRCFLEALPRAARGQQQQDLAKVARRDAPLASTAVALVIWPVGTDRLSSNAGARVMHSLGAPWTYSGGLSGKPRIDVLRRSMAATESRCPESLAA
jgi:hypothetical protein